MWCARRVRDLHFVSCGFMAGFSGWVSATVKPWRHVCRACFPARRRSRDSRMRPVGHGVPSSNLKFCYLRAPCLVPWLPWSASVSDVAYTTCSCCACIHNHGALHPHAILRNYTFHMYNVIITKYGMPVAYTTQNIHSYDMQHKVYSWCQCVCVCVCTRVPLSVNSRTRPAPYAGYHVRLPKFMHGTPARTPGADRYSACVIYGVLVVFFRASIHY